MPLTLKLFAYSQHSHSFVYHWQAEDDPEHAVGRADSEDSDGNTPQAAANNT